MTDDPEQADLGELLEWSPSHEEGLRDAAAALHPRELRLRHAVGLLCLVGLALVPAAITPSQLIGVIFVVYLMMFTISWDLVSGYTGQLSLGHAMFFGTGGYSVTILNLQHGFSPVASLVLAVAAAGVLGVVVGAPALRLSGPYLALVTLVVPMIMIQFVKVFSTGLPVLAPGGLQGDAGFIQEPASLVGLGPDAVLTVDSFQHWVLAEFYLAFALLLATLVVTIAVTRSTTGAVLEAIREDEAVVAAVGLNPAKYKLFAFTLSGMIGGLAGAGFVLSPAGHTSPEQLLILDLSLQVIVMAVLGGMGTIVGAPLGVLLFAASNELLNEIGWVVPVLDIPVAHFEPVPAYLVALGLLYYRPDGVLPMLLEWGHRVGTRVRGDRPGGARGRSPLESVLESYSEFFERLRK